MTIYSVASLIAVRTFSTCLATGLAVAQSLGIDTTTWRTGDPTKSTYSFIAEALSTSDGMISSFIKAAWLSSATGDWLTLLARDLYGVERAQATFATCTVTIKNNGGGFYPIEERDWVFKSSISGKTYHNVNDEVPLSAGVQLTIEIEADDSGSDSSAGANEIDSLVTTKLGVDILASTTAVGIDEQSNEALIAACLASRGALSPNGPPDAYRYVVTRPELTGVQDITRASTEDDSGTLAVTVYVAGPSGPVLSGSVTAAQTAVEQWATPLCITPTVVNSIGDTHAVSASVRAKPGSTLPVDTASLISAALAKIFADLPIGKDTGYDIDPTLITTTMRNAVPQIDAIPTYSPNTPVHVAAGHVPVLGTVSITVL